MSLTQKEVAHYAFLARIELDEAATAALTEDINALLVHLKHIGELDLDGVEPMTHATALVNVTRSDERRDSLPPNLVFKNAPAHEGNAFLVPRIGSGTEGGA
ncbi:MAG: Asp-tRNA(Asn)/Glu-tRNA(Gln) amidotransferase subunit GatC [Coriobacteriia bacterium]|nr:Asp-tRNA(Asn)/Glu-tRNA(Gln) amidotransferase subunit GatC [Coriobacteriia bacterium]